MKIISAAFVKFMSCAVCLFAAAAYASTNVTSNAVTDDALSHDPVAVAPSLPAEAEPAADVDSPVVEVPALFPADLVVSNPVIVAAQAAAQAAISAQIAEELRLKAAEEEKIAAHIAALDMGSVSTTPITTERTIPISRGWKVVAVAMNTPR